jgi:type III secretion protein J
MAARLVRVAALIASLLLAGCQQELYSNLSEVDANEMMTRLMASGIAVEKVAQGKDGFTLQVDSHDILRAMNVLNEAGYPKSRYDSLAELFPKTGLVTSEFEEHVRYIHLLEEKMAKTLSTIDGVMTARVHIVLPEAPQLGQPVKPSSAAVFIKHQAGVDLDFFVPQMRRLVSSSIEGLEYTAVTVVLTEAVPPKLNIVAPQTASNVVEVLPGLSIKDASTDRFWQIAGIVGIAIAFLIASNIAMLVTTLSRWRRKRPSEAALTVAEPS